MNNTKGGRWLEILVGHNKIRGEDGFFGLTRLGWVKLPHQSKFKGRVAWIPSPFKFIKV